MNSLTSTFAFFGHRSCNIFHHRKGSLEPIAPKSGLRKLDIAHRPCFGLVWCHCFSFKALSPTVRQKVQGTHTRLQQYKKGQHISAVTKRGKNTNVQNRCCAITIKFHCLFFCVRFLLLINNLSPSSFVFPLRRQTFQVPLQSFLSVKKNPRKSRWLSFPLLFLSLSLCLTPANG